MALALSIFALGGARPSASPLHTALLAVVVAFFSSSQDIVVDAYRADVLHNEERAAGISLFTVGYRLGMLAAGAGALVLVKRFGWNAIYRGLALSMLIGIVATLLAPTPEAVVARPGAVRPDVCRVHPLYNLLDAVRGAIANVAFIPCIALATSSRSR